MKKLLLGEEFVNSVLESVNIKNEMTSKITVRYLMRAMMAGVLVIFGYMIYLAISANFAGSANEPMAKVLAGAFFSLCLVSIYFTKSELLTSNMMMTSVAKYFGEITFGTMFKIMGLCFLGNLLGGILFGALVGASSIITPEMSEVMQHSIDGKLGYLGSVSGVIDLLIRALFCNFFINVSMLMVYSGNIKNDMAKIVAMFFGVFIFMYLGLEHSVANTVFFATAFFYDIFHPGMIDLAVFDAVKQVFWVLIGNFIGGGVLIGLYYSFINDGRKFK